MRTYERVGLSILVLILGVLGWPSRSLVTASPLELKAFAKPELGISTAAVPRAAAMRQIQNSAAWTIFLAERPLGVAAYIDPRTGTPASIVLREPLIPGTGKGNTVTLADLQVSLARPVTEINPEVVADVVRKWALDNIDVLAIAAAELGQANAVQVTDSLWQINIPQVAGGVPVRRARLGATLRYGNLVLLGATKWGKVQTDLRPSITAEEAVGIGFTYAGGKLPEDTIWKEPTLELILYAPAGREIAYEPGGTIGQGYGHRLVWSFGFVRPPEVGQWEILIDAHAGEIILFRDVILREQKKIKGGVYPAANTEICPDPQICSSTFDKCGIMQSDYPMPWTDTGLLPPNDFTDGAGVFEYESGPVTTTLHGKYFKVSTSEGCNDDLSETAPSGGELDLGGTNGQHRCDNPPGASLGNVPSARTTYYSANKIAEIARGWLPNNTWLDPDPPSPFLIKAIMPLILVCPAPPQLCQESASMCNAFYVGNPPAPDEPHIRFEQGRVFPFDWFCRPFGEIPSIVDHEWGHALDDNDLPGAPGNGDGSDPGEAYADIAAMYREGASCIGYGVWGPTGPTPECGLTCDGTGYNFKMAQVGPDDHCFRNCNGVREADYMEHADQLPDTPRNFVIDSCTSDISVCNRQTHCAAAPVDQAAWDFMARDLQSAPFNYDPGTASIVANKLFYQGSGNIGSWYTCDPEARTSDGCWWDNAYMQWLAADDDNGDLLDGTPHMTALYDAFHRHEIACSPNELADGEGWTLGIGSIVAGDYTDTWTSNDVREVLEEDYAQGPTTSTLIHRWRFDDVPVDVTRTLIMEGYRPNNTDGENFQFSWSNNGLDFTNIPGALIKKRFESTGGLLYPFGGDYSDTIWIRVDDTKPLVGPNLDRVHIDFLVIGENGPVPQNSGCVGEPTSAPTLSVTGGPLSDKTLSWPVLPGTTKYWIFKSEGQGGCDLGNALIAEVTTPPYVDSEVADNRQYFYSVIAVGSNDACFGPSSNCQGSPLQ